MAKRYRSQEIEGSLQLGLKLYQMVGLPGKQGGGEFMSKTC